MNKNAFILFALMLGSCSSMSNNSSEMISSQQVFNNFFSTANCLTVIESAINSTIEVYCNYLEEPFELNTFNFEKYNYYADIMYNPQPRCAAGRAEGGHPGRYARTGRGEPRGASPHLRTLQRERFGCPLCRCLLQRIEYQ